MWFFDHWSTHSNIRYQSFPSDNTADVFSRTFVVKNMSNSLTYTIASSCVCTSPLAVMTTAGLDDFVKVSISALLKSLVADHMHWRTGVDNNSLSSGFRVDAGRHLFSEGEKNVALSCSFNFNTLIASFHAASRYLALATLSPPETDPQILDRWSCADEVHLGKYNPGEGFWSRILLWRALAFLNFTRWVWFLHVGALA